MFEFKDILFSLYYVVKQLVTYLIISWSYQNRPQEDICSDLTRVKAQHWIENPEACNEFIDKYMNSLTTTIFSAYGLLLLFAFLVLIPIDVYAGSKSIVKRIVYKQLGLDDDGDNKQPQQPQQPTRKPRTKESIQQGKDTTAKNNKKKELNESLANNLISFLTKLNDLSNLNELYVLLKGLRKDAHRLLPKDDERRDEIHSQVNFETLQIE